MKFRKIYVRISMNNSLSGAPNNCMSIIIIAAFPEGLGGPEGAEGTTWRCELPGREIRVFNAS